VDQEKKRTLYETVKAVTGEISPIGETNTDSIRLVALREQLALIDKMVSDVNDVCALRGRTEFSIKKAGEEAHKYLTELRDFLIESLEE
jgi:hypothetical protein